MLLINPASGTRIANGVARPPIWCSRAAGRAQPDVDLAGASVAPFTTPIPQRDDAARSASRRMLSVARPAAARWRR